MLVKDRISTIMQEIHATAVNCGRDPQAIRLVAVAKTQPVEIVKKAIENGVTIIGENYIQEARAKYNALSGEPASWHFIGHLQTNKAKYAVRMFDLIHTVDSLKLAAELDKQAAKLGKRQPVLIQVNISQEASKSGASVENTLTLIRRIAAYEHVMVRGLMTMPPYYDEPEKARPYFSALNKLRETIDRESIPGVSMQTLSMGMSGDFKTAIEEGATLVRIGTAIFGARQ